MGYFQGESVKGIIGSKGILGEDYSTQPLSVKKSRKKNYWLLTYSFKGKAAFEKRIFGSKKD